MREHSLKNQAEKNSLYLHYILLQPANPPRMEPWGLPAQRNQCAEAARPAFFGTMRKPIIEMTGSA